MTTTRDIGAMLSNAAALREAGRFAEAVKLYRELLALQPDLPDSWYNVGWMERRLGRPEAALDAYDRALALGVRGAEEVHVNRGVIYADDLNRPEDAERAFRDALRIDARYAAALLNLANLQEDRGDRAEALALYERLLAHEPENWDGLARYANARDSITRSDPILVRLEAALARSDVNAADRASLGFALGRALDAAGAYEAAFDAYAAANAASEASAPAGSPRYNPEAHEQLIDAIMAAFPSASQPEGSAQPAPSILVCGMFRSGSTLLEQALGGHPRISVGGEMPMLPEIARALAPFPEALASLEAAAINRLADTYRAGAERRNPGADILTDKRPDNFLLVGLAKRLFPDAKIIHTVRDPLDTCLSIFFLHLDHGMAYATDLAHIGHYFAQYRRLMAHWKALYPKDIHDFDYDAFVRSPRETLEPALRFCGVEWDERCLAFHERASLVRTASVWQVREPLYARSSGRAERYRSRLGVLREALREVYPAAS
jgi:tetratricopeptide (TPR) repeat protein